MSDSEEEDEGALNEEEEAAELERARAVAAKRGNQRGSVLCSEATKTDKNWTPPKYEKSPEQRAVISNSVAKSFIFESLRPAIREQVIDAFKGPINLERGVTIIREGNQVGSDDPGLFVLESGTLEAFKAPPNAKEFYPGNLVFTYDQVGQVFGELALLYNCPRAASIISACDSVLWSLDRQTFNNLVKGGNMGARTKMATFLSSVEILSGLSENDRDKIVDVMQQRDYKPGQNIIKSGEEGTEFFILMEGKAAAMSQGKAVQEYVAGSYFGELALLQNQPRAVDVIASQPDGATVAVLEGGSFRRLLGNVTETLADRAKGYGSLSSGADKEESRKPSGKGKKEKEKEKETESEPASPSRPSSPSKAKNQKNTDFWGCCNCAKSPDKTKI